MQTDPFKEYLKQQEPDKKYKGYAWQTAIGLQAVDGLKPSEYLVDAAIQNIEGKITLDEVKNLLDSYYEEKPQKNHDRTEEADKVSIRIAKILSEHAFSFTPNEYISIHRKLFTGIYDHAGKIRDYNITKKEWVLNGATVIYGSASELRKTLEYDFMKEKHYSYKGLSMDEIIHHLAVLLQIYGRSIYLEKEIQERQPYFLSSIFEHLDLMQRMIYLRKMHGISEMHWFGQIIMI